MNPYWLGLVFAVLLHACRDSRPMSMLPAQDGGLAAGGSVATDVPVVPGLGGSPGSGGNPSIAPSTGGATPSGNGGDGVPEGSDGWNSSGHDGAREIEAEQTGLTLDGAENALDSASQGVAFFQAKAKINDVTVGSDGNFWLAEEGPYIQRLTTDGVFETFSLPYSSSKGTSITVGPDGNIWVTDYAEVIDRFTPEGNLTIFPLSRGTGADHITSGPDGNLWFSLLSKLGRITPEGAISEFALPSNMPLNPLTPLVLGPDGRLWFCASQSLGKDASTGDVMNWFGRVSSTGELTVVTSMVSDSYVVGLTAGPDGDLWFGEMLRSSLFRMTVTGVVTEFVLPDTGSPPYSHVVGPDASLWYSRASSNTGAIIGRITTAGETVETPLRDVSPVVLPGLTIGPDGNLWFTFFDSIARLPP
jgi:virginiamycin B lyase